MVNLLRITFAAATALLQPAHYGNARTLATAVARELKAEQGKRCSAREKA